MTVAGAAGRRRVWPPLVFAGALLGVWIAGWVVRHQPQLLAGPDAGEVEGAAEAEGARFWPYRAEARALLGGLDAGDPLVEGWEVLRVEGPLPDGRVKLSSTREGVTLVIWAVPRGLSQHRPPVETRDYLLFYDHPSPPEASVDEAVITALLELVAARVSAHEPGSAGDRP